MSRTFWILGLAAVVACNTGYLPRSGRRVSVIMKDGAPALVRAGKNYPAGGLFPGDEVIGAVAGDAAAEAELQTYRSQKATGTVFLFTGLAGVVAAGVIRSGQDSTDSVALSLSVFISGFILQMVGLGFTQSANNHLLDAVNIYNDDVER